MEIVNIAGYKFIGIADPLSWRQPLQEYCDALALKGTIVLANEGINLFLAGKRAAIDNFLEFLGSDSLFEQKFNDFKVKESLSNHQPFGRMVVRIAKEIITMRHPLIRPESGRAAAVDAPTLKEWLDQGHDDQGREIVLLDTRNAFEVEIGTFRGAINFGIERFSQFPEAIAGAAQNASSPQADWSNKTIVTFCTGGIRCEKAALYMNEINLPYVFQLEGGILQYFEDVGGAHWDGECFVFDERVALNPALEQTKRSYAGRTASSGLVERQNAVNDHS